MADFDRSFSFVCKQQSKRSRVRPKSITQGAVLLSRNWRRLMEAKPATRGRGLPLELLNSARPTTWPSNTVPRDCGESEAAPSLALCRRRLWKGGSTYFPSLKLRLQRLAVQSKRPSDVQKSAREGWLHAMWTTDSWHSLTSFSVLQYSTADVTL